jgi:hypothetical protein
MASVSTSWPGRRWSSAARSMADSVVRQYEGVMDLEVTEASGTIALQLGMADEDGERGWEWAYPVG